MSSPSADVTKAPAINCAAARARVSIFEVNKPDLDLPYVVSTIIPLLEAGNFVVIRANACARGSLYIVHDDKNH